MNSLRQFSLILILYILGTNLSLAQKSAVVIDSNGKEKLLGKITKDDFNDESFATWFKPEYENYKVDEKTIKGLAKKLKKYDIKVFMGTWCGDSKREVPRFYKLLETLDFREDKLTVVAVDNTKENYKKSPGGEQKGLNISKVPTFIFYKKNKEVNRIVESPIISLEKDIVNILEQNTYIPKYRKPRIVPVD